VIGGEARFGPLATTMGQAVFLDAETVTVRAGPEGLRGLIAYPGPMLDEELLEEAGRRAPASRFPASPRSPVQPVEVP
jgi:mannose-6-phosphate isomerase